MSLDKLNKLLDENASPEEVQKALDELQAANPPIPPELQALVDEMEAKTGRRPTVVHLGQFENEEQAEAAVEAMRAEHRKTCPDCQAEWEKEQAQMKVKADPLGVPEDTMNLRRPIGYMVFTDGKPHGITFGEKREDVEAKLAKLEEHPLYQIAMSMNRMPLAKPEIRPVFGD